MMMMNHQVCLRLVIQALFVMVWLVLQVGQLVSADHQAMKCKERERQALLHFKSALVDEHGMLSSWNESAIADCCQWKGVGCSNQTGHVTMLDLHGDDDFLYDEYHVLTGNIHRSLMELQQLQYLNLSWNDFWDSHIPEFISNLSNLRFLDLSYSGFGGKIPTQLGSLPHLQYLNLRSNYNLNGSIPYQLGNLSKLQYLDLSFNSLEGTIPSQLGNLVSLQQLYLGYNPYYYGASALKMEYGNHAGGQWLSNLTSLSHLDLSGLNNLNYSHHWLQMIAKLPNLRELNLSGCSLSDHFILSLDTPKFNFSTSLSVFDLSYNTFKSSILLFQWISNISFNLVELKLQGNNLEGPIPIGFGTVMISLQQLDFSWNRFKGGILRSIMNICTLRSLFMFGNNFTEDLATILHNLSAGCVRYSLQELDLSNNEITGTLSDLSIFPSLKRLDLSRNKLSGEILKGSKLPSQLESLFIAYNSLEGGIPKSFGSTCTLNSLDLSNNKLSDELPMIIYHLSGCARYSLQELHLDHNQINGTLSDLSIFQSLKELYLSENRLHGKIPEGIQFPSQLETLYMGSNSFEGVITDTHFTNMSKLKVLSLFDNLALTFSQNWVPPSQLSYLNLRSCKLGPAFPNWLQTQNTFIGLDISNAGISDVVPLWFWALPTKLERMNISFNNLKGTIPNLSLELPNLESIILTTNQFEGPVPTFLRSAGVLDLSKNEFSDFSLFLCANSTVETLGILDLSNNKLFGQIPDCWSHFKSLVYLDLSNNNFSRQFPTSIGSVRKLQALILRNNSLSGELPLSLKSCTKLKMIDVGENRLSGRIPSWIGTSLQNLQMLSLRRNYFFSSLSSSLCYLTSLHLLDLSLNNLDGQIPKCFRNFTAMTGSFSKDIDEDGHFYGLYVGSAGLVVDYSYDLNAWLVWKGAERTFENDELLLKSIDLSSNRLSAEIPTEIENLVELILLNLSRNNLTGKIPLDIVRLISLDALDLSRNHFVGTIPSSLAHIDPLSTLDFSHNNLFGEIPIGTQLQSFNASSYEDNLDLCGRPLEKMSVEEEQPQELMVKFHEDKNSLLTHSFYVSMAFGFIIGFWGIFGLILISRPWRNAYFRFLTNLIDDIYFMVAMKFAKYKRWLKG